MCLVASIWFIWSIILLWFKCNGKYVGCAAGNAFEPVNTAYTTEEEDNASSGENDVASEPSSISGSNDSIGDRMGALEDGRDGGEEGDSFETEVQSAYNAADERSAGGSQHDQPRQSAKETPPDDNTIINDKLSKRSRRTRVCFLFFSLVTLACVPVVILFSFKPMIAAEEEASNVVLESRDIISNTKIALDGILSATKNATAILETLPMDLAMVCPNTTVEALEAELAINLGSIADLVAETYKEVSSVLSRDASDTQTVLLYYEDAIDLIEATYNEASPYFWLVPHLRHGRRSLEHVDRSNLDARPPLIGRSDDNRIAMDGHGLAEERAVLDVG